MKSVGGNTAIDIKNYTKDKDGDGGGEELLSKAEIVCVDNGYILTLYTFDDEEIIEVYHTLEECFESIKAMK